MSCISIVIPVYNVEDYLRECVDSVLSQTFHDFDCVLVDDGSTDGSGAMCDAYAKGDSRIHVLHKANGGQSSARNVGIEWVLANSDSQWLFFLDGDDWIAGNCLEVLLHATEQTPIAIGGVAYVDNNQNIAEVANLPSGLASPEQVYISHRALGAWAWGKLFFKLDFAEVRFPLGHICEDRVATHKVFFKYSRVGTVKDIVYFYRFRRSGNAVSSPLTESKFSDYLTGLHAELDFFEKRGFSATAHFVRELLASYYEWAGRNNELRTQCLALAKDFKKRHWHSLCPNGRARKCIRQTLHPRVGWFWEVMWKLGGKKSCVPVPKNLVHSFAPSLALSWKIMKENNRRDGQTPSPMLERQNRVWQLFLEIADIFEANGIRYFLSWGSLLGALRHGDFIPGDDDWDVSVDDEDCARALDLLREHCAKDRTIREFNDTTGGPWPAIRVEDVTPFPGGGGEVPGQNIHIDLFRYRPKWASPIDLRLDDAKAWLKSAAVKRKPLATKWHSMRVWGWNAVRVCLKKKMAQMQPAEYNSLFPWKWIYPLRWVEVRSRRCPLPKEAEKLLVHLYGDWLAVPAAEERMHRHAVLSMGQVGNKSGKAVD